MAPGIDRTSSLAFYELSIIKTLGNLTKNLRIFKEKGMVPAFGQGTQVSLTKTSSPDCRNAQYVLGDKKKGVEAILINPLWRGRVQEGGKVRVEESVGSVCVANKKMVEKFKEMKRRDQHDGGSRRRSPSLDFGPNTQARGGVKDRSRGAFADFKDEFRR